MVNILPHFLEVKTKLMAEVGYMYTKVQATKLSIWFQLKYYNNGIQQN
jgi:hypothetical protein